MSAKTGLCSGRLYRGVVIWTLVTGQVLIFGENGLVYNDFLTVSEAEAFVDFCLSLSGSLIGSLG